jgi:hypothetical protein
MYELNISSLILPLLYFLPLKPGINETKEYREEKVIDNNKKAYKNRQNDRLF